MTTSRPRALMGRVTRHAWELDRRREREARARGDEFRRYTYGDVAEDRALLLAGLRALLDNPPA